MLHRYCIFARRYMKTEMACERSNLETNFARNSLRFIVVVPSSYKMSTRHFEKGFLFQRLYKRAIRRRHRCTAWKTFAMSLQALHARDIFGVKKLFNVQWCRDQLAIREIFVKRSRAVKLTVVFERNKVKNERSEGLFYAKLKFN